MKHFSLYILTCAVISAGTLSSHSQNLLVDPGAELQISTPNPATGYGQGWALFSGATFSQAVAHTGLWSIANVGPGGFTFPGAYQQFAASAGQQFTMTGYGLTTAQLNNDASFGILQITFFSGPNGTGSNLGTVETSPGNALTSAQINAASPVNVWIPLSVTATAPLGTQSITAFTLTVDQSASSMYFDDLNLTPVPEPTTLALTGLSLITGLFFIRHRTLKMSHLKHYV